jgi:hypothetical protein
MTLQRLPDSTRSHPTTLIAPSFGKGSSAVAASPPLITTSSGLSVGAAAGKSVLVPAMLLTGLGGAALYLGIKVGGRILAKGAASALSPAPSPLEFPKLPKRDFPPPPKLEFPFPKRDPGDLAPPPLKTVGVAPLKAPSEFANEFTGDGWDPSAEALKVVI